MLFGLDIFVQNNNVEYLDEKTNTWPHQRAKMVLFGTTIAIETVIGIFKLIFANTSFDLFHHIETLYTFNDWFKLIC